jgi:NADPH:quinone reductase
MVGRGVITFSSGDRVFGVVTKPYLGDGSFGELDGVPTSIGVAALPEARFPTAGALGLVGTSARMAVDAIELRPGQTVLISGATGGLGSLAIQLAVETASRVIATAHGADERRLVTSPSVPLKSSITRRISPIRRAPRTPTA